MTAPGDVETGEVPSSSMTRLALRVWRVDLRRDALLSINAGVPTKRNTWLLANAFSDPEGEWSKDSLMIARCAKGEQHPDGVPDAGCSCGLYAATDISVLSAYLSTQAPVVGVVELGGRTIPATQGYRAAAARVAAVLLIDPIFTVPHSDLRRIAAAYRVPALVPHSSDPERYRSEIRESGLGNIDWDDELRKLFDGGSDVDR